MNLLLPKSALLLSISAHFPRFFIKIDGFENPLLEIDGFGQTHRTHANAAPVYLILCKIKGKIPVNLAIMLMGTLHNSARQLSSTTYLSLEQGLFKWCFLRLCLRGDQHKVQNVMLFPMRGWNSKLHINALF